LKKNEILKYNEKIELIELDSIDLVKMADEDYELDESFVNDISNDKIWEELNCYLYDIDNGKLKQSKEKNFINVKKNLLRMVLKISLII